MKPRTALHIIVGLLVAIALVFFATNLQAGVGSSMSSMIAAQRRAPILWIIDACAVAIVGVMWWYAIILSQFQEFMDHQGKQHHEQLDDMIERTSDLEQLNDSYADRIERLEAELARQFKDLSDQVTTLEASSDARRKVFEIETRRISEHAFRIFQAQLEANTRHVEAMSMALQFQRSELRRLRHEFRELQHELAPHLSLRAKPVDLMDVGEEQAALSSSRPALEASPEAYGREPAQIVAEPLADTLEPETFQLPNIQKEAETSQPVAGEASSEAQTNMPPIEGQTADRAPDYSTPAERNLDWKSQVDRLFYEAQTIEALTEEDLAQSEARRMPPLRMVDATPSITDEQSKHELDPGANTDTVEERALTPATEASA